MPNVKLVGVSGPQRSGKTWLCRLLAEAAREAGLDAARQALAEPLYRVAERATGDPEFREECKVRRYRLEGLAPRILAALREVVGEPAKPFDAAKAEALLRGQCAADAPGRALLQAIGTEIGRAHYGEDIWVEWLTANASAQDVLFVDDVRFMNERQALDIGLWIESADAPAQQGAAHASERDQAALREAAGEHVFRDGPAYRPTFGALRDSIFAALGGGSHG